MSANERAILLLVQYDGTDFHGWQTQLNCRTVQETLSDALNSMVGERPVLRASSRTDAGVHSLGLPVLFTTTSSIPEHGFVRGLNGLLPTDVSIKAATEVPQTFHVRQSASGKIYRYRIWNNPGRSAIEHRTSWHVPTALDGDAMQCAAASLVGEHDFSSFRAATCQGKTPHRRITAITVERSTTSCLTIEVQGNAFLQHMVRIIVGTLVEVGRGFKPVSWVPEVLAAKDRTKAGPTAPGKGLFLHEVIYEPTPFVSEIQA